MYNYYTDPNMKPAAAAYPPASPRPAAYQYSPTYLPIGLKGRPVSSIEEARAQTIDFDGSIFFFPDLANRRIYTKQINMDGTASLNVYELQELPIEPQIPSMNNFITREEFEAVINQLKAEKITTIQTPTPESKPQAQPKIDIKTF